MSMEYRMLTELFAGQLWVCPECGCVVVDTPQHNQWHIDLNRRTEYTT